MVLELVLKRCSCLQFLCATLLTAGGVQVSGVYIGLMLSFLINATDVIQLCCT